MGGTNLFGLMNEELFFLDIGLRDANSIPEDLTARAERSYQLTGKG